MKCNGDVESIILLEFKYLFFLEMNRVKTLGNFIEVSLLAVRDRFNACVQGGKGTYKKCKFCNKEDVSAQGKKMLKKFSESRNEKCSLKQTFKS